MKLMIDLETLGTKPNSAILSIGAVAFDKTGLKDEFYCNIDLKDSIANGFDIDTDTVYWWLSQDKQAGSVLSKDKTAVATAMFRLCDFIKENQPSEVWANSPSFDLVMLKNALQKMNMDYPYPFWIERDFRTFLSLTNALRVYPAVAHNALEDAKSQAQTVINWLNKA